MPWWRFWEHDEPNRPAEPAPTRTATVGKPPARSAPAAPEPGPASADPRQRLARLRRQRESVAFDAERAEAAVRPDNPWQERIDLLAETIANVRTDLAAVDARPPAPSFPLPETPITEIGATAADQASVSFAIGPEHFVYEEEVDWDQRGGPLVRGDLRWRAGDAFRLLPTDTPTDLRDALTQHLVDSLAVFAVDLRDRALDGEALPATPTLADLARPCPDCGGWRDWRGTCAVCAERAWRRQQLRAEASRLEREQTQEAEERHTWAERRPVARRRLAEVDAEIAKLDG